MIFEGGWIGTGQAQERRWRKPPRSSHRKIYVDNQPPLHAFLSLRLRCMPSSPSGSCCLACFPLPPAALLASLWLLLLCMPPSALRWLVCFPLPCSAVRACCCLACLLLPCAGLYASCCLLCSWN